MEQVITIVAVQMVDSHVPPKDIIVRPSVEPVVSGTAF
jgi:hypothetical protein